MAAATAIIWILPLLIPTVSSQHLGLDSQNVGICTNMHCRNLRCLQALKRCTVVLGNLKVVLMEREKTSAFKNIRFPNLREVTGFMVVYRVSGLLTLGEMFPNLSRIRGTELIINYALIVHDMSHLKEVGLYGLLRIDRGGVFMSGGDHTCYIRTIDWDAIAPQSRHWLAYPEMSAHCNKMKPCKCSNDSVNNYCWNSQNCQRFLTGPRAEQCHPECLGCRGAPDVCSTCRHYTYRGRCLHSCPENTIPIPDNQYCVSAEECNALGGWKWNNTCMFNCPYDYIKYNYNGNTTCFYCFECEMVCPSLVIDSLSYIQNAGRCVHINGSLTIRLRSVPTSQEELNKHLKLIQTVRDYVHIFGSLKIQSLGFLSSLKHIAGKNLKNNSYSVMIHDMNNLKELFPPNVMNNLEIHNGKLKLYNNPKLCLDKIDELKKKFPEASTDTDIPIASNGYSGGCEDSIGLKVNVLNKTAANVTFSLYNDPYRRYTVLYAKVTVESHTTIGPEACDLEWFAIHADKGEVLLTSLRPASTYAVCVEVYTSNGNNSQEYIARTTVVNFTTPFSNPEPPFIKELVATSPNEVTFRWTDHKDYRQYITHYQLGVILIGIPSKDLRARNHCGGDMIFYDIKDEYNPHVSVVKPPLDYDVCDNECLNSITAKSDIEDHFDILSSESECDIHYEPPVENTTYENYVKTLSVVIGKQKIFKIKNLAPYRDYKIRLRSCAEKRCSRSTRRVIRTLRSLKADVPTVTKLSINETGHVFVKWKPPDVTNGPLFVYNVHFLAVIRNEVKYVYDTQNGEKLFVNISIPDSVCVYPEYLFITMKLKPSTDYKVRVCSSTLGSLSACSPWTKVLAPVEYDLLLLSFLFSMFIIVVSFLIGFLCRFRKKTNDTDFLVDITSRYRSESEPPTVMMLSDFMPSLSVPLTDNFIEF